MELPGVIVMRVNIQLNQVEWYYNHKLQAQHTIKEFNITHMKSIKPSAAIWGEGDIVELI